MCLISLVFLVSCNGMTRDDFNISFTNPLPTTHPETLILGDSICDKSYNTEYTAAELSGFTIDCEAQRRLSQHGPSRYYEKNQYEKVIIQLGVNDALRSEPVSDYRSRLIEFLNYDDAEYWCVAPLNKDDDIEAYRQVIFSECTNTIDPSLYNLSTEDGIHWSGADHIIMSEVYPKNS